VGMTRAKEQLYLCHAREREFRGSHLYAVPSCFLGELSEHGVEFVDFSKSAAAKPSPLNAWRGGSSAAERGWEDAGVRSVVSTAKQLLTPPAGNVQGYDVGMKVRHEEYGVGKVTEVSGYGALRKIKVRFASHGERAFI